jgi:hypothetical protein
MGILSFSRIKYSLLRWTYWINAPRLLRALVMGIMVTIGEDVLALAFRTMATLL